MKSNVKQALVGITLILAVIGGWYLWNFFHPPEFFNNFAVGNGRIEAVQVNISAKTAGRVKTVFVKEGDLVKANDVLAQIDTVQIRAQQLRAKANVASAESLVASAKASIAQVKALQILAKQELSRIQKLIKKGHVSKESYDIGVSKVSVAKANLEAAKAVLISRLRNVDAARAAVIEIQTQINDSTLVAPTIGRVLYRLAEPGEIIGNGGKVLTLLNLSDVYMEVFLPAAVAHHIAIGAEARIKLDVLKVAIPANVSFISPQSQFTPKQVETQSEREKLMFRVKVRIPESLVLNYIERVKTGVRGVVYIRLTTSHDEALPVWPDFLQQLPVETKFSKAIHVSENHE